MPPDKPPRRPKPRDAYATTALPRDVHRAFRIHSVTKGESLIAFLVRAGRRQIEEDKKA